jgi:hypothetical protein
MLPPWWLRTPRLSRSYPTLFIKHSQAASQRFVKKYKVYSSSDSFPARYVLSVAGSPSFYLLRVIDIFGYITAS